MGGCCYLCLLCCAWASHAVSVAEPSGAGPCSHPGCWVTAVAVLPLQEAVQVLIKHSADVNARDKNWQTPLHVAAANKAVKCAEILIPLLSSVNVSDRGGRTALHHAALNGHIEVSMESLTQHGLAGLGSHFVLLTCSGWVWTEPHDPDPQGSCHLAASQAVGRVPYLQKRGSGWKVPV